MAQFVISLIENYGLWGVFIGTFLSYSIIPIPTDIAIVLSLKFFNPYIVFFVPGHSHRGIDNQVLLSIKMGGLSSIPINGSRVNGTYRQTIT